LITEAVDLANLLVNLLLILLNFVG